MSQGQTSQRLRPFKPLRFGRYTLLMPISTGGMGEIFLARLEGSHGFDKLCVIKKILPHLAKDQEFVSRFVDEAHILVKLSHGNIAQVLDMGVHEGEPYIALEFVDGKDLRRVLARMRDRQLPLPLSFVLSVMTRVLDALAYAHRKRGDDDSELNLVHRDVSPQNVLISYEGEVKVIDFGLAKSALSLSKTNPSIVMGKFMYMAPEQARHKVVDRRSDLYAVGLCLWELVTGKNPFEDVPSGELMGKVGSPQIPALNSIEPLCPQALSDAVARALAPDPVHRFQAAEEFRGKLQAILQDIDPQSGAESTSRFMRDAFAAEYQAERRMLNTVKEQARALGSDEADEAPPPATEETLQNAASPFATHPTPLSMPALTIKMGMDDETPSSSRLGLQPEALSFQPTRKAGGSSKSNEVHEKETMPSIQLKTEQLTPLPSAPQPIRARVLAKSFDNDSTEASTPAIAAPEPLPSIVIDGIPSEPVHTELEMPAQQAPPPPRASKASLPKQEGTGARKAVKNGKSVSEKVRTVKEPREAKSLEKPEKTGERPLPKVNKPPPPQRTDTQVLAQVPDKPSAGIPTARRVTPMIWFVLPVLAVAAVVGLIAFDVYRDGVERDRAASLEEQEQAEEAPPPAPEKVRETPPVEPEAAPEVAPKEVPRKKQPAPAGKTAKAGNSSPAQTAMKALQGDFDRLVDEAVQRKFRLQLSALEGQVDDKGSDPAFVKKVQALHEQVKVALAKQQ